MEEQRQLANRRDTLWMRARIIQAIRKFFFDQGYLEVETPYRIPAPAPEAHIDAVSSGDWFLHTSPELCMKRLLAANYPKIFQICKCFREGERGAHHLPEFTLLEWYHQGENYIHLMQDCEDLILFIVNKIKCGDTIPFQGKQISLQVPWEKLSVREAFEKYCPDSLKGVLENNCFDEKLVTHIEPHLGQKHPLFLYDYPISLASSARAKEGDITLAERFELYMGGIEIANGFSELIDAGEQKRRFEKDQQYRRSEGKTVYPDPQRFLDALSHMPEAAGIALGVDRLIMLLTDSKIIDHVVTLTPETL
jgi:lysyl-tRNA synthetase class 2